MSIKRLPGCVFIAVFNGIDEEKYHDEGNVA